MLKLQDDEAVEKQRGILNTRADYLHVDLMDGHYCKIFSISPDLIRTFSKVAHKPMDVHLMKTDPMDWIEVVAKAGAGYISSHAETINTDAYRTMNLIQSLGCKTGVVLNPATSLSFVEHYLNRVDMLTIMTIDVDFAGHPFVEEMLEKIKEAKRLKEEKGYTYKIQIDGSCNDKTYGKLYKAGAEVFIVGCSGLFQLDDDSEKALGKMEAVIRSKIRDIY